MTWILYLVLFRDGLSEQNLLILSHSYSYIRSISSRQNTWSCFNELKFVVIFSCNFVILNVTLQTGYRRTNSACSSLNKSNYLKSQPTCIYQNHLIYTKFTNEFDYFLKKYYTPNLKSSCFVCYFKIINTFIEK